ncbi:exo-beta-N-acetylmuramidase NamZ family protein [Flavobacterium silvaticum]|nr:DUF1343 domain-containing protein [Flavobacterium silvaticum]
MKGQVPTAQFHTGASNTEAYFELIDGKDIGIVTNQTGIVDYDSVFRMTDSVSMKNREMRIRKQIHLVDFLVTKSHQKLKKIYAPEHGFRGTADDGEDIKDGKDTKTGIPIISIYGDNKKPSADQLKGIDVMLFDLQDVGTRFYTYISTLHYVMEACAENKIPLIVLDRPNPNGSVVDGPTLEKQYSSFVGMHPIPVLHGLTIGEYARMINGEKWLKNGIQCDLTVIPCLNYNRQMTYHLPVRPSPNLPNDRAINLYPSLCFFEGTNVSIGRGTEKQFQVYGSPNLPEMHFEFTPKPNFGSKNPPLNGKICCGEDLSFETRHAGIELKWLLKAYQDFTDKPKFFISYFTKLAGSPTLQRQIESGMSEAEIRQSWKPGIDEFKKIRKPYEIY